MDHCERQGKALIIGSDANAQNPIWGSTNLNPRGEALEDFVEEKNLVVINECDEPTFIARGRREVLDVTLSNWKGALCVSGWRVCTEDSFSDHIMIMFSLHVKPDVKMKRLRLVKKTDWGVYSNVLRVTLGKNVPSLGT